MTWTWWVGAGLWLLAAGLFRARRRQWATLLCITAAAGGGIVAAALTDWREVPVPCSLNPGEIVCFGALALLIFGNRLPETGRVFLAPPEMLARLREQQWREQSQTPPPPDPDR